MSSPERVLRAKLATAYRVRERDPERIASLRRDLAAQQIRDHIIRITTSAPLLLAEQRRELADLVLAGGAADE